METLGDRPAGSFSGWLWAAADGVYAQILGHPFLRGLTDGTLPRAAFRHFLIQDAHYLTDYARALAVCAARAPSSADLQAFAGDAVGAIAAEQALHADLLAQLGPAGLVELGGSAEVGGPAEPVAPTTLAYTSYLLATVYGGSFTDGLAAVLPCYWIYARVGETLLAASSPDPLYARWIETYGGDSYQDVVHRILALTDRVGADLTDDGRRAARSHFLTTSRYEYMFWDAAWRREHWPV